MNIIYSLISATIISLVSLVGVFSLIIKEQEKLNKIIFSLVGFSAGAMMGGAFFHLLPEALDKSHNDYIFLYLILGFITFFLLEKFILWHHCHKENCEVHPFGTLNLIGDSVHNFIDGMFIFVGFSQSLEFGITISLLILLHEIPQELGDFGILIYSGYTTSRALFFNLLSSVTCIFGVIFSFFVFSPIQNFSIIFLMPFAAGGFLYIAASDLIPELHRQQDTKKSNIAFVMFIMGLTLMWIFKTIHP